jgi:hypothetical protein
MPDSKLNPNSLYFSKQWFFGVKGRKYSDWMDKRGTNEMQNRQ